MTTSVLDTIVQSVIARLPARKADAPLRELESREFFDRSPLSLANVLRSDRLAIIAELKRASPSAGMLRQDLDPAALAYAYTRGGADAISVVTEPDHFQGSVEFLASARSQTHLPLLRKDFIMDPYQIVEAKAYGADAVLLIASILSTDQLKELQATTAELGLSALVEVHDRNELDSIDQDRTDIIGVNNRNLATFEVDILRAPELLAALPDHIVRVAESGLKTGEDLAAVRKRGIDAVLIGEAFMTASDPGHALQSLRAEAESLLSEDPE